MRNFDNGDKGESWNVEDIKSQKIFTHVQNILLFADI